MAWMTILGLDWKGGRFAHPLDIVDVPHKPGVFKLHARRGSGEWEVFYVGQAQNLYSILLAYLGTIVEGDPQAAGINACAKARVEADEVAYSYAVVEDETERQGCLRSLYEYFRPVCNSPEQIPAVDNVACNPY